MMMRLAVTNGVRKVVALGVWVVPCCRYYCFRQLPLFVFVCALVGSIRRKNPTHQKKDKDAQRVEEL